MRQLKMPGLLRSFVSGSVGEIRLRTRLQASSPADQVAHALYNLSRAIQRGRGRSINVQARIDHVPVQRASCAEIRPARFPLPRLPSPALHRGARGNRGYFSAYGRATRKGSSSPSGCVKSKVVRIPGGCLTPTIGLQVGKDIDHLDI